MKTGQIIHHWISLPVLAGLILSLFLLMPSQRGESEETASNNASQLTIEDEQFVFVPGKAMLVEDHYVLALYQNSEKGHYALALFDADCNSGNCSLGDLIAYSIFDSQGNDVQVAGSRDPASRYNLYRFQDTFFNGEGRSPY